MVMESVGIPGSASKPLGNQLVSPESATASSLFDQFVQAQTIKAILSTFRYMCEILRIKPTNFPNFYPKLKAKVKSWKAQSLWTKFDKRASHKSYSKGKACSNTRVLIIGAGPCGLRAAIEAQLLGAKVVVVEKRDRLTRNNVLHLWPFVIHDLRNLGAKKFFGKFCAGTIDHISIRQLQCILLKVALLLGVEIHESVSFDDLVEPCTNESQEKTGWRALVTPRDHPVAQYEFDVLIGADGKRNTLKGFKRKEFRGKLAIAITANFVNRRTEDEARVEEISGVAFIFNQKFFQELRDQTGIDLENIVYYKDDTHYFVMTAKKTSLLEKGVIIKDYADTVRLLSNENVCREALLDYAREAADFSTHFQLPHLDFAVNCQGLADVAMFDFTSMFQAENACRIVERKGYKLLQALVGDSLLEPFWPTGSGCARGFLSSMDTCWMIRSWSLGKMTQTEVLAERESIYRLLAQTTPENLSKAYNEHALDPHSRYPNLNTLAVRPAQVRHLYDSDVELKDEILEVTEIPRRKRKRDSFIHPDTLLNWCQRQIALYSVTVTDLCTSWKNGLALCAIIHRYRPDLINFDSLNEEEAAKNNQLAFDICDREFGIHPVMTGKEMADCDVPDKLTMMSYISQIYDTFRGEIPHIARNLVDMSPEERPASPTRKPMGNRLNILTRLNQKSGSRKRHSSDTLERQEKSSVGRIPDIENDQRLASGAVLEAFRERTLENSRKSRKRRSLERDRALFILNKDMKNPTSGGPHKADLLYVDKKDFNSRVRDLEEKLCRGTTRSDNLSTSPGAKVGRIDRSDWNVKMLEERMKGQSNPKKNREDVPLYNRDIFEDKLKAMDSKLHRNGTEEEPSKFNEFDTTLKKLDLKLKEGNNLETGLKGSNKVSAMAEQLASFLEPKVEHVPLQRTGARTCMIDPQGGSENCHFCGKRVYLMERQSAQGKFFHRGCFKCECCGTSLRLGSYGIDAEGIYSGKFLCMQHFGLGFFLRKRSAQDGEEAKGNAPYEAINPLCSTPQAGSHYAERLAAAHAAHRASAASSLEVPDSVPDYTRGVTPERVEFENTLELISEDELLSEIDEDEWTDRNFGTSTTEIDSSDEESDFSDEEIYPEDEEKIEEAVRPLTADETRRLAESWKRRYSKDRALLDSDEDDDRSDSDEEYAESNDEFSYEECLSDEQGSTPTECANDKPILKGPEKRDEYNHQDSQEDSGTEDDTEVFSGAGSNGEGSETESELEDDDQLAATHSIPTIVIDESPQNATNEDDEEYFHSLKEQSMQAEKALSDMRSHAEIETIHTQNVQEEATPVEPAVCDDTITSTEVADEPINENTSAAVEDLKECYSPDADLESVITDKEPIGRSLGSLDGCSGVEIAQRRNSVESASSLPDLAKISVPPMPLPARSGSTDSPRAKMMLELKEKYLLGSTGSPEGASKEETHHQTAEHQPVMKSIMDLISQKQKMLNPAVTLATSGSDVKREIPGLLLNTLNGSSNLNSIIASSATLGEVAAVSELLNEGLQVDEVRKDVVEECFLESQPGLDLERDTGESKFDVSDCKDNVNMGEHVSEKQNETNGHVESPEFQFPSERDTDLDVDSGEIGTEPLGDVEENLEDSQLDERFITKRKKKKIVDPDASNADVQSTVFTATLIQTGSVDSLDVLESEKPPSKSEAADTSQIGLETLEITNNVVQSSDSEEDKIWSEKDSDLIDSMSKDLSESMEGDMLGSLPGSNDGRDSQQTSAPRYEGSNFRRFSEKTGPFGGMRDSIDIRKSAQRRRPPLFRGDSAGCILDPRSSVELKEAEMEKADKVVLRRKPNTTDEAKNNRNSVHDNLDEIPFVDDESNGQDKLKEKLNMNKSDVYRRPPLQRPMSLVEKSSTSPVISPKRALLLDTPLTNPNIGQTPISVSVAIENLRMMRTVERERAREEARNRARMKTDEELGIRSPTDFSNLKKKWHRQDSKMSDSDSKDGSSLATSPSEEFPSEPSPIAIASFSPSSPKELLIPSQSSSSIVTPVSDLTPDDISKSLEESPFSVTPASPSEHEVSVDDVQIDVDISPLPTPTLPPTPISDVPIETEQQSPPVLPPKNRASAPIKDTEKQSEKSHKPKEKKSSIFSRLAAGLGKSESSKSKSKEKEEKSPQGSSTLADLPIKVDGAPKESRFPKLRLNRSKEKAKEKRRQKSIEGSSNTIKDREDSFSSLKTTSSEERDEIRSRERTPSSSVEVGEGLSPIKDVERNGISPLRPKEQDMSAPVSAVKETEAREEKEIVEDSALLDNQASSYERNKVSPRPILDRQSLIQSMISLSQSPASSSNKCENGVAPKATGDSFSDPDEDGVDEKSQASTSSGGRKSKDPGFEKRRKLQRIAQRLYRQQEQKRLRKAQEIQRELEELEVKLKELEEQGVEVERALRGENADCDKKKEEPELMQDWFHLVHDKNVLMRQEQELMVKAKELELEDRHNRLQKDLYERMAIDNSKKTEEQLEEEERILAEMLETVEQRDALIAMLDEDRQRHQEEDQNLERNLRMSGLNFTPKSKT